jgi:hypothetical protein
MYVWIGADAGSTMSVIRRPVRIVTRVVEGRPGVTPVDVGAAAAVEVNAVRACRSHRTIPQPIR